MYPMSFGKYRKVSKNNWSNLENKKSNPEENESENQEKNQPEPEE